jgi:CubicO group peptidase (beta-lactamase class C family)
MHVFPAVEAGMSADRLKRVTETLEREVAGDQMAGIIALAQRRGKVIHHSLHGKIDIAAGRTMEADAIFRIYSMTKPIVSVALMILHDQGRVQLHDPVANYIPCIAKMKVFSHISERRLQTVDQDPPMTVFHLLTHMSGLSNGQDPWHPVEVQFARAKQNHELFRRDLPLAEVIERISETPLRFQPGSDWVYGVSTDVLGYLVQVIADMPLAEFLHSRIFQPLGMVDTDYYVPPDKLQRLAKLYRSDGVYNPQLIAHEDAALGDVRVPTLCPSGSGGLVSTMADYLRFANMLINQGELDGTRIVSPIAIRRMTTNAVPRSCLPLKAGIERYGYGFGLGFRVMIDPGSANGYSSLGEYGWSGAANTHFVIDPRQELITLMMTQHWSAQFHPPRSIFPNLIYQAIEDLN